MSGVSENSSWHRHIPDWAIRPVFSAVSSQIQLTNPRPYLASLTGKDVAVRLLWGQLEYRGRLESTDEYMNLRISGIQEWQKNTKTADLGEAFIRCNNVLWIKEAAA